MPDSPQVATSTNGNADIQWIAYAAPENHQANNNSTSAKIYILQG